MAHIMLHMPRGGEDGVIIGVDHCGYRIEFRGRPYSQWDTGEDTPMYRLHSRLKTVNISDLHNSEWATLTPWNVEWHAVLEMFKE